MVRERYEVKNGLKLGGEGSRSSARCQMMSDGLHVIVQAYHDVYLRESYVCVALRSGNTERIYGS